SHESLSTSLIFANNYSHIAQSPTVLYTLSLHDALPILARLESGPQGAVFDVNRREARIPAERAAEFNERLAELLIEFADQPRSGSETYVMLYGLYRSERGALAEHEDPAVRKPGDEH